MVWSLNDISLKRFYNLLNEAEIYFPAILNISKPPNLT